MRIEPLTHVPIDPVVASLPKAHLHLHQEAKPRLDRVAARRRGRPPHDWRSCARRLIDQSPPGMGRLIGIYDPDAALDLTGISDAAPENFIARVVDVLQEGAADGAVLVEVRFGLTATSSPVDFMPLFREAEQRVQEQHPRLRAEAICFLNLADDPDRISREEGRFETCLRAADAGLGGVDFRIDPYDTEADPLLWATAYRWAERAVEAGLGITVHAGEFSPANLAAALRVPGLKRLGHAVYAAADPRLLEQLAANGITVECSLTCNVVLGAVPAYEAHPIRQFVDYDIPVTLNTDLPVHVCTTL